jgi:hypothetical protein
VVPTAAVINALTPEVGVKALGNQLKAPGGGITVLKGCEGVEVMFMLAAAFAAVAMPWRRRLTGLGLGITYTSSHRHRHWLTLPNWLPTFWCDIYGCMHSSGRR